MDRIRILIADDHPLFRKALREELESQTDFEVVAETGNGEKAIQATSEMRPDVVLMDISMPDISGIEATRCIKEQCPDTAVLVLTVHDETEHVLNILQAGASGYLTKDVFGQEVVQSVRGVAAGESVLSPSIFQRVIKHAAKDTARSVAKTAKSELTSREYEILKSAANGLSNRDIASSMKLSEFTVKSYLAEIYSKFGVNSRTEAVVTALKRGIITIDSSE